jgi:O-antigen/teichoic acid export membrane protein
MSGIRKNTFWAILSNGIVFLLGLVTQVVIGRKLGPVVLGEYYLMITTNLMATAILSFGVGLSNMTFAGKNEYSVSQLNATSLLCAFGLGIIGMLAFGAIWLGGINIFGTLRKSYLIVPFAVLPFTLYMLYWNYLMIGLGKIVLQSKLLIVLAILWCSMNLFSIFAGFGMGGLIFSWIFYAALGFVSMLVITRRQDRSPMRLNLELLRSALVFGLKGNIGEISTQIWKRLNIFILNYFHGVNTVGVFSVASEINDKVLLFAGPIRNAVASRIISSSREDGGELTAKTTRNVLFWLFPIVLFLFLGANLLVSVLYGKAFAGTVNPMRILLLGTLIIGGASIISVFFVGQLKRPGLLSLLAAFNALVSVVFGLALIPRYGIYGISLGYTLTCVIGMALMIYFFRKFSTCSLKDIFLIKKEDFREYRKSFIIWR